MQMTGIHHVTAIAGAPAENVAFYTQALGLRLVKKTVNFDDPGTWHLYYGDQAGRPGSILTFFPFPGILPGRAGTGSATETAFRIAPGSVEDWLERFADLLAGERFPGFTFEPPLERFGEAVIRFTDPDGLPLSLVGRAGDSDFGAFDGVTLSLRDPGPTARLLTEVFGYAEAGQEGTRLRLQTAVDAPGNRVDLVPSDDRERRGAGTVHHVAFRTPSEADQLAWRERVLEYGIPVTEVKDRQYFRSIYFREPGGVLFEIATDPPGFTADEDPGSLGSGLKLPPWLESRRPSIEARLPSLTPS